MIKMYFLWLADAKPPNAVVVDKSWGTECYDADTAGNEHTAEAGTHTVSRVSQYFQGKQISTT